MKDTSSILFHDVCFISSFANLSHGFIPGNFVGISDTITRHFANSEILESFPVKALQQMPAMTYDKPALFTSAMVNDIVWTSLHKGNLIDCTIRKTILTNPPIDPETCLVQLIQSSPPEEFLNLLLNGVITPTHSNWFTEHKKFTKLDFANLLTKCEAPRLLAEISRIMKLDDLARRSRPPRS